MSESRLAYCGACKEKHYFGFDECGAPTNLLSCWEAREPVSFDDAAKESAKNARKLNAPALTLCTCSTGKCVACLKERESAWQLAVERLNASHAEATP